MLRLAFGCSAVALTPSIALRQGRKAQGRGAWITGDMGMQQGDGLEFRGAFRDFSLWREQTTSVATEADFAEPVWVVEFDNAEEIEGESARAKSLGLDIILQQGKSLMLQGDVPKTLGYDACGGSKNKTVVPVADHEVTPGAMPASDLDKYKELAKTRNAKNIALRAGVSQDSLKGYIEKLQGYGSRNSYTGEGGTLDQAADWAADQLERSGFDVTRDDFRPGSWISRRITPQVVAELPGTESPERIVVIGAHLDSINQMPFSSTAPGADDNGSGSAAILELARIIGMGGAKFKNTLRLVLFTGEEQGLLGSKAIARRWKQEGTDIICMLNADMLGYKLRNTNITFSLVARNTDPNLLSIVQMATETYMASQVDIGRSTACCSDQQAFYENGFPAMGVFETPTRSVVYPQYHSATDLIDALDMEQMALHSSTFFASVFLFAEIAN